MPLTSNLAQTDYDVIITNNSLEQGDLIVDSRVKISRIFSVEQKMIKMNIGRIDKKTFSEIKAILHKLVG